MLTPSSMKEMFSSSVSGDKFPWPKSSLLFASFRIPFDALTEISKAECAVCNFCKYKIIRIYKGNIIALSNICGLPFHHFSLVQKATDWKLLNPHWRANSTPKNVLGLAVLGPLFITVKGLIRSLNRRILDFKNVIFFFILTNLFRL